MKSSIGSMKQQSMKLRPNRVGKIRLSLMLISVFFAVGLVKAFAAEYRLQDFLILVDEQLVIRGHAIVTANVHPAFRSDLGSRNNAVIGGIGNTFIPDIAPSNANNNVAIIATNVTLGNFAKTSHIIYGGAQGGSFNVIGTAGILGPSLLETDLANNSLNDTGSPDLPDFPPFPTFVPGAVDIATGSSGTVDLAPGSYRDLIVGSFATVNFTASGTYNFRRIIANSPSRFNLLMLADDIQINVKEFVRLAEYGNFNPTGRKFVSLYVEGVDDSYGGANRNANGLGADPKPAAFEYDGDGAFNACLVFVVNGTINVRGKSSPPWANQWFGRNFQEISNLRITLQHPGEGLCIPTAVDCACITDFKTNSDGTLRVTGINFNDKTVDILAFYKLPPGGSPISSITDPLAGGTFADQASASLNFVSSSSLTTVNDVEAALLASGGAGDYILGIIAPIDPNTGLRPGYCIFTNKELEIPFP